MKNYSSPNVSAVAWSVLFSLLFVSSFLSWAVAVKIRFLDPGPVLGRDVVWWVLGVTANFFTGIAVLCKGPHLARFLMPRLGLLRFWFVCGSMGGLGFGGVLVAWGVAAISGVAPSPSGKLFGFLIVLGLVVIVEGIVMGAHAFRTGANLAMDLSRGAVGFFHDWTRPDEKLRVHRLHPRLERKLKMRAIGYNAATVGLGVVAFFAGVFSIVTWVKPEAFSAWVGFATATMALLALVLTVHVRRARNRWMYAVARYECFDLFLACVKEQGRIITGIGRRMVSSVGGPVTDVTDVISDLRKSSKEDQLRRTFYALQKDRDDAKISAGEYRSAIDRLFGEASGIA